MYTKNEGTVWRWMSLEIILFWNKSCNFVVIWKVQNSKLKPFLTNEYTKIWIRFWEQVHFWKIFPFHVYDYFSHCWLSVLCFWKLTLNWELLLISSLSRVSVCMETWQDTWQILRFTVCSCEHQCLLEVETIEKKI